MNPYASSVQSGSSVPPQGFYEPTYDQQQQQQASSEYDYTAYQQDSHNPYLSGPQGLNGGAGYGMPHNARQPVSA